MAERTSVVMTFKVEPELARQLRALENTSEFIRSAVRDRIGHVCPLCDGRGTVTALQQLGVGRLLADHDQVRCARCGQVEYAPCHPLDDHVHGAQCSDPWMAHIEAADDYVCRACFTA